MTAPRSRLVAHLVDGHRAGRWRYLGLAERYVVEVTVPDGRPPVRREHRLAEAYAWLAGFNAGAHLVDAGGRLATGQRTPDPARTLLVAPSADDARRASIWWVMDTHGVSLADVAAWMGSERVTPRTLLTYGHVPRRVTTQSRTLDDIETAIRANRRRATFARPRRGRAADVDSPIGALGEQLREPVHLQALRAVALAYEAGLVESWSPQDPNGIRRSAHIQICPVGSPGVTYVDVACTVAWVRGLTDGAVRQAGHGHPDALRLASLARSL